MNKLLDLKREAVRTRRKLDKITDRQEREKALKTYARLLHEIIEIRRAEAEKPIILVRS